MARPEKVAVVEEIKAKLTGADAAVLTEYRGLTVGELAALRQALRPTADYKVFKNSLARRAVEQAGLAGLTPLLEGPVAIAFVHGDAVVAAKALRDFGRMNPALVVKGGLLGERVLDASELGALADVEPREVLLARLAGGFQAPLTKAAGLFQAFTRNFAYGLKAYIDTLPAAPEAEGDGVNGPRNDTTAPAEPEGAEEAQPEGDGVNGPRNDTTAPAEPEGAEEEEE